MHKHDGIPLPTRECDVQGSCGTLEANVWVFQPPDVKPNGNFMVRNQIAYPPQRPDHFIKTRKLHPHCETKHSAPVPVPHHRVARGQECQLGQGVACWMMRDSMSGPSTHSEPRFKRRPSRGML